MPEERSESWTLRRTSGHFISLKERSSDAPSVKSHTPRRVVIVIILLLGSGIEFRKIRGSLQGARIRHDARYTAYYSRIKYKQYIIRSTRC